MSLVIVVPYVYTQGQYGHLHLYMFMNWLHLDSSIYMYHKRVNENRPCVISSRTKMASCRAVFKFTHVSIVLGCTITTSNATRAKKTVYTPWWVHKSNDVAVLARLRQKQFYWTIRPKKPHTLYSHNRTFSSFSMSVFILSLVTLASICLGIVISSLSSPV